MKRKFLLILAVSLFIVGAAISKQSPRNFIQDNQSTLGEQVEEVEKENLTLILHFADDQATKYSEEFLDGQTAFGLLKDVAEKEGVGLDTQEYDFGIFVKKIADKETSAEMAWIYFVNGESGQVASDQYSLEPGDVVEWKYMAPSGNGQ